MGITPLWSVANKEQRASHVPTERRGQRRRARPARLTFVVIAIVAVCMLPGVTGHAASAAGSLPWNTNITSGPTALSRPAVALGQDGNVYVFGGTLGNNTDYNTTFIYQPGTNTWSLGASMPVAREGAKAVTLPDGRIAVLGGATQCSYNELCSNGTVYNRVDVYNPSTNSWATLAPMQSPRYRFAAVLYNGQIYAIGGSNGTAATASVEAYTPISDTWSTVASLPQPEMASAAAVDGNGHIDVLGGFDGGAFVPSDNNVFIYDGSGWTDGAPLPQATEDAGAAVGADGQVYVIGGFDLGWLTTVQAYNPGQNSWSFATPLPSPTCCTGAVTMPNGQIYVVDGGVSAGSQVAVYGPSVSLTPPAGPAGTTASLTGTNFTPSSSVNVYWGTAGAGTLLGSGATDDAGALISPISFTVPATATPGAYTVTAVDDQSRYPVTTTFTVAGTAAAIPALSTLSGSYQQQIMATGVNFKPGEPVILYWDRAFTHPLALAASAANGVFQARLAVPATTSGVHYVIAWGWQSHRWAIKPFLVRPATALANSVAPAGASNTLYGYGFPANAPVRVYWNNAGAGGALLGTTTASAQGSITLAFAPPSGSPGTYNIISMGQADGGISTLALTR